MKERIKNLVPKVQALSKKAVDKAFTFSIPALAGFVLISLGISFWSLPASLIVGGLMLVFINLDARR